MYKEILSPEQIKLLTLVKQFKHEFYLVGGTAIALQIGHRRSIDFDLFKQTTLNHQKILQKIKSDETLNIEITRRVEEQLNMIINDVKFTFFQYPFNIQATLIFEDIIKLPDLLTLSAMKAYAIGRRSKWKDYVDLYYLLKNHYTIKDIGSKATELYGNLFSEKLFRSQISFFKDIDFSEKVEFMNGFEISESQIKKYLTQIAIDF